MRAVFSWLRWLPAGVVPWRLDPGDCACPELAEGLDRLLSRQHPRALRKILPCTVALQDALRRGREPPSPQLLLDAMHECWGDVDTATQRAFKECLQDATADARMPRMH